LINKEQAGNVRLQRRAFNERNMKRLQILTIGGKYSRQGVWASDVSDGVFSKLAMLFNCMVNVNEFVI